MKIKKVDLPNGYTIRLFENTTSIISEIWDDRFYEQDFMITKNMNILDIGANQGVFSLYAASKGANVYSIEPECDNYKILKKNIKNNNLENNIRSFEYAISDTNGYIDLFIPDRDIADSSALVSTSRVFLKNKNADHNLHIQKAPCITLENLLSKLNLKKIDLLKIDCEGAEIDILNSAPPIKYENINYIVLETHSNYTDKEIITTVKNLGFNIINYKQLHCVTEYGYVFETGYLFAENKKIGSMPVWIKPVLLLNNILPYYKKNDEIIIDSSGSFSTVDTENKLIRNWFIDGREINNKTPRLKFPSKKNGLHNLELEIIDMKGGSESATKDIWIFEKTYFEKDEKTIIHIKPFEENILEINEEQTCSLKTPNNWPPMNVVFYFVYDEETEYTAVFEFNGDSRPLKDTHTKISYLQIPSDFMVYFSLRSKKNEKIKIRWWFSDKRLLSRKTINSIKRKYSGHVLLEREKQEFHELDNDTYFIISHEDFPRIWIPKYLIIKILDGNEGYFEFNNRKIVIDKVFKLIQLDFEKLKENDDIIFKITNRDRHKIIAIEFWYDNQKYSDSTSDL